MKVEQLGQVFTPHKIVQRMLCLRKNQGPILEPSCGDGAFLTQLESAAVGLEVDSKIAHEKSLQINFFDYDVKNTFNTIIGNPPYVAFKHIEEETKNKLRKDFDERTNLYVFFIDKCLDHLAPGGELIFITPRDFIKLTSAKHLNERLSKEGSFTHFYDLGDEMVFDGASPNCAIWRWERNRQNKKTETNDGVRNFYCLDGQICFTKGEYSVPFKSLFLVKVGAVSGADKYFIHPDGEEFVFSETRKTGQTRRMIFNKSHPVLVQYKEALINRKIKKFNESNWYRWGRDYHESNLPTVYVNCKTRQANPFFTHPCKKYDGAVMAIFCKTMAAEAARDFLNEVDWDDLGFKVGGRFVFCQRSLQNTMLPNLPLLGL